MEAEATLEKIIAELDEAMRKAVHRAVRTTFARNSTNAFKQLFGGGKGTLELMDDEDVLEAGIRIIAPAARKETAEYGGYLVREGSDSNPLLFAIQDLKPSPFCLMREAALDDSNVDRFGAVSCCLRKNTQFIVITHRRVQ